MDLSDYQQAAMKTAVYKDAGASTPFAIGYTALGLAGEAGEVANKVKKVFRDDHLMFKPERRDQILAEVGDCLWYCAQICTELNADLDDVALLNLAALAERAENNTIRGDGDVR